MKIAVSTAELGRRKERIDNVNSFKPNDRPAFMCFMDAFQYLNNIGMECEDYMADPHIHFTAQLEFQKFVLENFATDQFSVDPVIDLMSVKTASAFGSEVRYIKGGLPWAEHWIESERDILALDKLDVANNGLFLREKEFKRYAIENAEKYPVEFADGNVVYPLERLRAPSFSTEGPFSILQMIMGMEPLFMACYDKPEFVHKLLDVITEKQILHWQSIEREFGKPAEGDMVGIADDTAAFLNADMFEEFCVPYLKRVRNTFPETNATLHFCKTVPHYVALLMKEFPISRYLGFKPDGGIKGIYDSFKPVNDLLGNKILLYPDPDPCNIGSATAEEVYEAVRDILRSFEGSNGVCVCFSTWEAEKSHIGMKVCEDFAAC